LVYQLSTQKTFWPHVTKVSIVMCKLRTINYKITQLLQKHPLLSYNKQQPQQPPTNVEQSGWPCFLIDLIKSIYKEPVSSLRSSHYWARSLEMWLWWHTQCGNKNKWYKRC
jgi:hypothetical protein